MTSWAFGVAERLECVPLAKRYDAWLDDRRRHTDPLIELREHQAGLCAVCQRDIELVVDHDHDTGLVRGLLCFGCNISEGLCPEAPWFVEYRRHPPAKSLGLQVEYGRHLPAPVPTGPPGTSLQERFSAAIYLGLCTWPEPMDGVDASDWQGLGVLYYELGAATLVWDAERLEERRAAV